MAHSLGGGHGAGLGKGQYRFPHDLKEHSDEAFPKLK